MTRSAPRTVPGLLGAALAGALLAACAAPKARVDAARVHDLIDHGKYREAVVEADRLRRENPGVDELDRAHRKASLAWLLERGRRATFEDEDVEALEWFERALALDPSSQVAASWHEKTRRKLSGSWYVRANEALANGDLDAALAAFERSLEYDAGMDPARLGKAQVLVRLNYRQGLSEDYYNEGVRALHDYWLRVALGRFRYVGKYRPDYRRAERRAGEVEALLAKERLAVARQLESEERFAAARNEYRIVLTMDPSSAEAQAGLERMTVEAGVQRLLESARMDVIRGRFSAARESLAQALETTAIQREEAMHALADIEDVRLDQLYQRAIDLERDFRFEAAIAVFEHILAEREWYEDSRARLDTLRGYVEDAARLYEAAEGVGDPALRLALLRQIAVFWPEYRDVPQRIADLEAAGVGVPAIAAPPAVDGVEAEGEGAPETGLEETPAEDGATEEAEAEDLPAEPPADAGEDLSGDRGAGRPAEDDGAAEQGAAGGEESSSGAGEDSGSGDAPADGAASGQQGDGAGGQGTPPAEGGGDAGEAAGGGGDEDGDATPPAGGAGAGGDGDGGAGEDSDGGEGDGGPPAEAADDRDGDGDGET